MEPLIPSYGKLAKWKIGVGKQGALEVIVELESASSEYPKCHTRVQENGYGKLKYPSRGFEADRDTVGILNIEDRALKQMGISDHPNALQTNVNPDRWGEYLPFQEREEVS